MKGVYQIRREFGRGNCVAACVATIHEVPLEEVDWIYGYTAEVQRWTDRWLPAWEFVEEDLCYDFDLIDVPGIPEGEQRWTYEVGEYPGPPVDDYWIASVDSAALKRPPEDPYYPMPATHVVVMLGDEVVWDPNSHNKHKRYFGNRIHTMMYWRPRWKTV